jgi:signal transduction histidine kinase
MPIGVAALGLALCVLAIVVIVSSGQPGNRSLIALVFAFAIGVPAAVGLWASVEEEDGRFGQLLFVAACLFFLVTLGQSSNDLLYSIGLVGIWLVEPVVAVLVLAFPAGELRTRLERGIVWAYVVIVGLLYLPTALMVERYPTPVPYASCRLDCPGNAFLLLDAEPSFVKALIYPVRDVAAVLLFLLVVGVLGRRVRHATPVMRRIHAPVLGVAILRGLMFSTYLVTRRAAPNAYVLDVVGWILILSLPGIALAFLVSLLRGRLAQGTAMKRLALQLRGSPEPDELRAMLAEVVADPSLELIYSAAKGTWVDAAGRSVDPPEETSQRSVTEVSDHNQIVVAALIYDSALRDQQEFVKAAGSFALASLENQRLAATVDASLKELQESRARILAAADSERLRIERDLHDGAQQRLVALRIRLELFREVIVDEPARGARLFRELESDLDEALEDVRSLAHGIYPALLADQGLEEALRSVARRTPLVTTVDTRGIGRYSMEVESAVYFSCLEALQNAAKHAAGATSVSISVVEDGTLRFVVRDDGAGFAEGTAREGTGFTNMRDRLAAVGGELKIRSVPDEGTEVEGVIPLWHAQPFGA